MIIYYGPFPKCYIYVQQVSLSECLLCNQRKKFFVFCSPRGVEMFSNLYLRTAASPPHCVCQSLFFFSSSPAAPVIGSAFFLSLLQDFVKYPSNHIYYAYNLTVNFRISFYENQQLARFEVSHRHSFFAFTYLE